MYIKNQLAQSISHWHPKFLVRHLLISSFFFVKHKALQLSGVHLGGLGFFDDGTGVKVV